MSKMKKLIFILLLAFVMPISITYSQTADSVPDRKVSSATEKFDPIAATNAYINSISTKDKAMSDQYFEGGYWLILWSMVVDIIVAIVFLFYGLSKWMKKISLRVKNVNLQNLIYIMFYLVFSFLLAFPYSFYKDFIREHHYGLSNLSFGAWLGEDLISLAVNVVLLSILLVIIYFAIRKAKERWWIWAAIISTAFMVVVLFIGPVFIAPLYNSYTELPAGKVRNEILSLARANGIPTDHVYEFDASKQTKRISANVSGIGKTIRISLNDNLLNRCSPAEIKSVMAHEMGHYVLHHMQKYLLFFVIMFFLGFWLCHKTFYWLLRIWGKKWDITGISDIGGLPLLMVILSFYLFLATPITNSYSRQTEAEADIFGLNAAREPDGFAQAAMMTSEYRKADPGHWEEIIFYDHPSPRSRILMAMKWKAENLNNSDEISQKE